MKPTAPGSLSHIICFAIYFICLLFSDLLNLKIQNYLAAICFIWHSIYQYLQLSHVRLPISRRRYPKGIDNHFNTSGCEYLLFVCRCCLHCVAWFSYRFDNLGLITEGNTYRCCVASSLPLWGNTDVVQANIKRNFWRRCRGGSSQDSLPATH